VESGSPTLLRRRLGRALRGLREHAGLTGDEAGARVERSGSWISRVEAGRVGLRVRDLQDLLDLYQLDDLHRRAELEGLAREGRQRGWWSRYSDSISEAYSIFIGLEAEARTLLSYDHIAIPGLLQTEDYCRALVRQAARPELPTDLLEARVQVRMTRQAELRKSPPELRFVLDEAVLHRAYGGKATLRNQLQHLTEVVREQRVDLRVITFDHADLYLVAKTPFVIMEFPQDPSLVYIETLSGATYVDEPQEMDSYSTIFESLTTVALEPAASAALIEEMADKLT